MSNNLKHSKTDEEPSAKKQKLLCRSKKIDLSEDEINSNHQQELQSTPKRSPVKQASSVSVSNVSNIELRKMVTKSLSLKPTEQISQPIKPISPK